MIDNGTRCPLCSDEIESFKSWSWFKVKFHKMSFSFFDWISNPMICLKSGF